MSQDTKGGCWLQDSDLYDLPWNDSATCQDFDPEAVAQAEQEAQEQWEVDELHLVASLPT